MNNELGIKSRAVILATGGTVSGYKVNIAGYAQSSILIHDLYRKHGVAHVCIDP